MGFIWIITYCH